MDELKVRKIQANLLHNSLMYELDEFENCFNNHKGFYQKMIVNDKTKIISIVCGCIDCNKEKRINIKGCDD